MHCEDIVTCLQEGSAAGASGGQHQPCWRRYPYIVLDNSAISGSTGAARSVTTNQVNNFNGTWTLASYQPNAPGFSISGCSATSLTGTSFIDGGMTGSYTSGAAGTCTVTLTSGTIAQHGYFCSARDTPTRTRKARLLIRLQPQYSKAQTASGDVIIFNCSPFRIVS
jgi:hypothetical protein